MTLKINNDVTLSEQSFASAIMEQSLDVRKKRLEQSATYKQYVSSIGNCINEAVRVSVLTADDMNINDSDDNELSRLTGEYDYPCNEILFKEDTVFMNKLADATDRKTPGRGFTTAINIIDASDISPVVKHIKSEIEIMKESKVATLAANSNGHNHAAKFVKKSRYQENFAALFDGMSNIIFTKTSMSGDMLPDVERPTLFLFQVDGESAAVTKHRTGKLQYITPKFCVHGLLGDDYDLVATKNFMRHTEEHSHALFNILKYNATII